jgi:peptide/nickel transport system ATP-binding protein
MTEKNTSPLLAVEGLTVSLPRGGDRSHAVNDVSFQLNHDEILCIVGESGSGKSITAHAVIGLLPPNQLKVDGGRILLNGRDIAGLPEEERRKLRGSRIAMIFQEPMTALNPIMRIGTQVEEIFEMHTDLPQAERKRRVLELFKAVLLPEPEKIYRSYPFNLSGGQRQRVMIAMALALEPAILIADEPTTALDVTTQAQILALIKDIQRRKKIGVLFITHDFGVVAEIADRVAVLQRGKLVEVGTKDDILNRPQHPYTCALIAAVPEPVRGETKAATAASSLMVVKNLNMTYPARNGRKTRALDGIELTLHAGETVGLVGESGSGKSTLGKLAIGLLTPDGGSIGFNGNELVGLSPSAFRPYRREIQMVFQDPFTSLNPRHRVGDIIAQGPLAFGESRQQASARARELLELVGLDASAADRFPHQFSGGQRQRIGIARALALNPKLLIADEAVSALDVSVQAQVLELLADIKRRLNLSMLFITHDLRIAAQMCDRIAVLNGGRIVELNDAHSVFFDPQHEYTRKLIASIPGKAWTKPELAQPDSMPL